MSPDELSRELTVRWHNQLVYVGMITQQAVHLEMALDQVFCALVESKFAAVVSGGQGVAWLIRYCRQLVKVHTELSAADRQALNVALDKCSNAVDRRNSLVHSLIFQGPIDGPMQLVKSRRGTHEQTITSQTLEDIRGVLAELIEAEHDLAGTAMRVLGEEVMQVGSQLRAEGS